MAEVWVLAPDARVELIDGEIVDMPSIGSPHSGTAAWLHRQFIFGVGDSAIVASQSTIFDDSDQPAS